MPSTEEEYDDETIQNEDELPAWCSAIGIIYMYVFCIELG